MKQSYEKFFETFYQNDSQYARTGKGPLLHQPHSTGIITRAPRAGFKGNEGYGAPDELNLKWPTFKKKKARIKSRAKSRVKRL